MSSLLNSSINYSVRVVVPPQKTRSFSNDGVIPNVLALRKQGLTEDIFESNVTTPSAAAIRVGISQNLETPLLLVNKLHDIGEQLRISSSSQKYGIIEQGLEVLKVLESKGKSNIKNPKLQIIIIYYYELFKEELKKELDRVRSKVRIAPANR